jgi:outer membrane receptor for Fe3+-dicitrate
VTLATNLGSLTSSNFYQEGWYAGGVNLGPFASNDRTTAYENSHPGLIIRNPGDVVSDRLSEYFGNERVTAAYVMHTLDVSRLHINAGLRLENTFQEYRGNADTLASDFNSQATTGLQKVVGRHTYNDLFPSAQLKFEADENTNVRLALTRGIARPDYSRLAPTTQGTPNSLNPTPYSLTLGNPHLKAETSTICPRPASSTRGSSTKTSRTSSSPSASRTTKVRFSPTRARGTRRRITGRAVTSSDGRPIGSSISRSSRDFWLDSASM